MRTGEAMDLALADPRERIARWTGQLMRLQEARRLMLTEPLDAASAGHRVGYGSPSQFSREYSREFGASPLRDVSGLREAVR